MIIGHQKIQNFFEKSIKNGNLSHAYLFSGPEHLGKFSLALELAQKITQNTDLINPDIIILAPEVIQKDDIAKKSDIKIESVRELVRKLYITSSGQGTRVAIIDQAQMLNKSAQNALLKTLEEPPKNSILFLITVEKEKLLPTIISRCQSIRFNGLAENEIAPIIPDGVKDREDIIFWSLGRPGLAKIMLENEDELKTRKEMLAEFIGLFSQNVSEKMMSAENLSKNVPQLLERIGIWTIVAREIILGKNISTKRQIPPEKILKIIEKLSETGRVLKETNANARLTLENLFLEF